MTLELKHQEPQLDRETRIARMENPLLEEFKHLEENLIGKRPKPTLLLTTQCTTDTFWQDFLDGCIALDKGSLPSIPKLDFMATTTTGETLEVRYFHVEPHQWATHTHDFKNHVTQINKKRRGKAKFTLQKLEVYLPHPDTRSHTEETADRLAFAVATACSAHAFIDWTGGSIQHAHFPPAYPKTRLREVITKLQALPESQYPTARENTLKHLQNLWKDHKPLITGWEALLDSNQIWHDEPPQQDLKPTWSLPLWTNTPEGRILSQWDCFSGSLIYLNRLLGYQLLDLDTKV